MFYFHDVGMERPLSPHPTLVYRDAFQIQETEPEEQRLVIESVVRRHHWHLNWIEDDAVFEYPHYHSTSHEVLMVLGRPGVIRVGGTRGMDLPVQAGYLIAIPAGVVHQRIEGGPGFIVAGLYPVEMTWDLLEEGNPVHLATARKNIPKVPLPQSDPLWGTHGPIMRHWQIP
jgi:uncharacterized protein YjlB